MRGAAPAAVSAAGVPVDAAPAPTHAPAAAVRQDPDATADWQRALLDRYCVACHNDRVRTADLALDRHDVTRIAGAPEVWETVVRKLRAGAMPPPRSASADRSHELP